ncbi:hypothetical protein [Taibaiella soli]|nr:hypothetical protein [Taibaiella soli]
MDTEEQFERFQLFFRDLGWTSDLNRIWDYTSSEPWVQLSMVSNDGAVQIWMYATEDDWYHLKMKLRGDEFLYFCCNEMSAVEKHILHNLF